MPSLMSIKFGLQLAGIFLVMICLFLGAFWKVSEYLLSRELRRKMADRLIGGRGITP